ncbi:MULTISPECIES: hypothetical protein [Priestia]|jgi:hypothetical protein|uniref:hypothetical protein n=1 Tax=Priestia TaxID=2800373 RepID=UPI0003A366E1|nr:MULTISPECIES: hypothetical protein [Priestia]NHH94512.1 hypothetical protein [Bacillus sp. MB95]KML31820.1 hypothetical protein VL11_01195 [Priestia aryabhattai]KMN94997.1 hypothetical protein ABV89_23760 [Priestia aryabhattai]KZE15631.1 hypothetical protein AVW12_01125 [Priestia aryabhattai]MBY0007666.1 hypothetical protein [Priestia aryabhattai]
MDDYYGELCTRLYEVDKSVAKRKELEFYLSFVKDQNMKVLEPMCGKILLTIIKKKSEIEELVDWTETNRVSFNKEIIVVYKKSFYDRKASSLNTKIKYELLQGNQTKKVEIMDFPLRLYGSEEFERILSSNGFNNLTVHEVKDGYGEGMSFSVYECRI